MQKSTIKTAIKYIWTGLLIIFCTVFISQKLPLIREMLDTLNSKILILSFISLLAAKIFLSLNMRISIFNFNLSIPWKDCYRIYNLTQLAKYIPGSIWQFVSRIAILNERGISSTDIRKTILCEHIWVVLSAGFLSLALLFQNKVNILDGLKLKPETLYAITFITIVALIVFTFANLHKISKLANTYKPPIIEYPVLFFIWFFLGFSLWITLSPFSQILPPLWYIICTYCLAYLLGFLVPFAPAGLGVREAVIVLFLAPFTGKDEAIFLAAINRVLYFLCEVILALTTLKWLKLHFKNLKKEDY